MQLLGTIINIYQKQIVQDQILEEIIAVKPLLVDTDSPEAPDFLPERQQIPLQILHFVQICPNSLPP